MTKRLLSLLLAFVLLVGVAAGNVVPAMAEGDELEEVTPGDPTPEPAPEPTPEPEPTPAPETTAPPQDILEEVGGDPTEPGPIIPPEPHPIEITKHPTGETVVEGQTAVFIARADYIEGILWYLVSPDESMQLTAEEAMQHFFGLRVAGAQEERLTLSNIPLSMNGWFAVARFISAAGSEWSYPAKIIVKTAELQIPAITGQPEGGEVIKGDSITLTVTAISPDGNTVSYQWYRNDRNSNTGGSSISGATSPSYTPEFLEGTYYYYCLVRNTRGQDVSAGVKSSVVAVTCKLKAQETTAPTETTPPETTAAPTETTQETFLMETQAPGDNGGNSTAPAKKNSHTLAIVICIVLCVAIIATSVVLLIFYYFPSDDDDDEEEPGFLFKRNKKDEDELPEWDIKG